MIRYLLDTNSVIALVGNRSDAMLARFSFVERDSVGISSIVAHELYYGAYKSRKIEHNLETLRLLLDDLLLVDFQQDDARAAGEIRAQLARKGTPIGSFDILIAGQAKQRGATLVTNNTGEFRRVEGLRLEDWTETRA